MAGFITTQVSAEAKAAYERFATATRKGGTAPKLYVAQVSADERQLLRMVGNIYGIGRVLDALDSLTYVGD